jgi:hypothetical protein
MPQSDNLPLCLPVDLSDEAAATLIEFLYELTEALESRYFVQLRRYHQENHNDQRDPDPDPAPEPSDPPF